MRWYFRKQYDGISGGASMIRKIAMILPFPAQTTSDILVLREAKNIDLLRD
jgi:hypothetical protein